MIDERRLSWARKSAVHYLSQRSSSTANLKRVMVRRATRRWPDDPSEMHVALADEAVSFCVAHRFVDDALYAAAKVASSVRKGQSRRKITAVLAGKGLCEEHVEDAMAAADDLRAAACFARRRKFGPWRSGDGGRERELREAAAMARAGFPLPVTFRMISMGLEEAEKAALGRHEES